MTTRQPPKPRSAVSLSAKARHAGPMHDRRAPRGGERHEAKQEARVAIQRPRSPIEAMIDAACGIAEADYEVALDADERAAAKQESRDDDARALASGEKSLDQLRAENGLFAFPNAKIDLSRVKPLTNCACAKPGGKRMDCADGWQRKSPCRCGCHAVSKDRTIKTFDRPGATLTREQVRGAVRKLKSTKKGSAE